MSHEAATLLPHSLLQEGQRRVRVHSQVLAGGFAVVSQVRRPVPLGEQVQQLDRDRDGTELETELETELDWTPDVEHVEASGQSRSTATESRKV